MVHASRYWVVICLCLLGLIGCGGGSGTNQTTDKSELEKYLSEHPESANAEMPELNE